jgi:diguanylate cyclase
MPIPFSFSAQKFTKRLEGLAEDPPVTLALADVDRFKEFNDTFGHDKGDLILKAVTSAFEGALEGSAFFERMSGDAYLLAMPATGPEEALLKVEEIRRSLEATGVKVGKRKHPISLSFGIASYPHHAEDPAALLKAADEAMERAKREGRGRAAIWVEDKMVLKSNYYTRGQLGKLSSLAEKMGKTEAALLRQGLEDLLDKHRSLS